MPASSGAKTRPIRQAPYAGQETKAMDKKNIFEDLQSRIGKMIEQTPVKDIEKNLRALITQTLSRLDMVTREEYDAQAIALARLREQVSQLQAKIDQLEQKQAKPDATAKPAD